MAVVKTCSFCGEETTRLFYANPKCCTKAKCLMEYKNKKHEEKKSKGGSGTGKTEPRKTCEKFRSFGYSTISKKPRGIKPISEKQAERLREYRLVRDEYRKEHPICECCNLTAATDIHHKKGRGEYLSDPSTFLSVCRPCHRRIEENPEWAKENGYSLSRL